MKKRFEVVCNEHGIVVKTEDRDEVDKEISEEHKNCKLTILEHKKGFRSKKTILDLSKNYEVGG